MSLLEKLKSGKTKVIAIPNSDEKIHIRALTMREMKAFESSHEAPDVDHAALLLHVMILAVTDEAGGAVWTKSDEDALHDLPLATIGFVSEEVLKYSGVTPPKNA